MFPEFRGEVPVRPPPPEYSAEVLRGGAGYRFQPSSPSKYSVISSALSRTSASLRATCPTSETRRRLTCSSMVVAVGLVISWNETLTSLRHSVSDVDWTL